MDNGVGRPTPEIEDLRDAIQGTLESDLPESQAVVIAREEGVKIAVDRAGRRWERTITDVEFYRQPEAIAGLVRVVRAWLYEASGAGGE